MQTMHENPDNLITSDACYGYFFHFFPHFAHFILIYRTEPIVCANCRQHRFNLDTRILLEYRI